MYLLLHTYIVIGRGGGGWIVIVFAKEVSNSSWDIVSQTTRGKQQASNSNKDTGHIQQVVTHDE